MSEKYDYDAVIIGAGIGGLVCGCYLAKAGMKTLIVEKNAKPGGYCTSFTRKGFFFDACAHSLGSLREGGIISNILKDLNLEKRIVITKYDPQDIILTPNGKVNFWNSLEKTILEFQTLFPNEADNIVRFFTFIDHCKGIGFNVLRRQTFQDFLNKYFKDDALKNILSLLAFGNAGLPASKISAFSAVTLYKEFVLDGGYYPKGGIQKFPDILTLKFKELGGVMKTSKLVKKLGVREKLIYAVILDNKEEITSRYVISDCDSRQTFFDLIGKQELNKDFIDKLDTLTPSISMFVLYLGLKENINVLFPEGSNIWVLPYFDLDKMFELNENVKDETESWYMLRIMPDRRSLLLFTCMSFKNEEFWRQNKKHVCELLIKRLEKIMPSISSCIVYKDAATPNTLFKWTLNHAGASYGWAAFPSQFAVSGLSQATVIKNLYLTGHWATLARGIPGVAHLGVTTAGLILSREGVK